MSNQLQVTGSMSGTSATFSSNVAIGSNSITNGTTFGGGSQINRAKVQSGGYTCLEINGSINGGSIQFTYGTNLPNQVGGLMGYNYATGTANEFAVSNLLNGPMVFGTNNLERIRILSAGDVQIGGAVSGGGKLQVNGDVNINGNFKINGTIIGGGGGSGVTGSGTSGYVTKWTGASTLANSVLYDSGTNIGIGTSTPNSYLHINGTSSVKVEMSGGTAQNGILFNAIGSAPQYYIGAGNNLLIAGDRGILLGYNVANASTALFYNSVSDAIIFGATASSERARITNTGSLIIATTTDIGSGYKLQVNGSISMAYASFFNFQGSSGAGDVLIDNSGSTLRVTGAVQLSNSVTFNSTALVQGLLTNYNVYNTQTSSYTLVLGDASKVIEMNVASANTVTIPTNASVAFPIGTEITVLQYGVGITSIAVAGGVSIVSKDSASIIGNRYTGVTLLKRGTNEWYLIGNIVV
jgi:hypothetical protein